MKKRWFFIWLIPISVLITVFMRNNLSYAEYYSVNIYPFFVKTLGVFSYKSYESAAELIIFALIMTIIILTAVTIVESIKYKTLNFFKKYIILGYQLTVSFLLSTIYKKRISFQMVL